MEKEAFLNLLVELSTYVEDGVRDYLHDNGIEDWWNIGKGSEDVELLLAIGRIRRFVQEDNFLWEGGE